MNDKDYRHFIFAGMVNRTTKNKRRRLLIFHIWLARRCTGDERDGKRGRLGREESNTVLEEIEKQLTSPSSTAWLMHELCIPIKALLLYMSR